MKSYEIKFFVVDNRAVDLKTTEVWYENLFYIYEKTFKRPKIKIIKL